MRPFVKQFALPYPTVVSPVPLPCPVPPCLSVCDVGVLWPNGWIDQAKTWHGGRPESMRHCVRLGPSSPPAKNSTAASPHISAHVYCGQMAGWIKMPLGMEVQASAQVTIFGPCIQYINCGPGEIVLDKDLAPPPRGAQSEIFGPCLLIVAKRLDGSRCHLVWR